MKNSNDGSLLNVNDRVRVLFSMDSAQIFHNKNILVGMLGDAK